MGVVLPLISIQDSIVAVLDLICVEWIGEGC